MIIRNTIDKADHFAKLAVDRDKLRGNVYYIQIFVKINSMMMIDDNTTYKQKTKH